MLHIEHSPKTFTLAHAQCKTSIMRIIWELVHLDIMDIYRYLYIYIYLLCVLRYLDIHLLIEHIHLLMEHIHVWICIDIYV